MIHALILDSNLIFAFFDNQKKLYIKEKSTVLLTDSFHALSTSLTLSIIPHNNPHITGEKTNTGVK